MDILEKGRKLLTTPATTTTTTAAISPYELLASKFRTTKIVEQV